MQVAVSPRNTGRIGQVVQTIHVVQEPVVGRRVAQVIFSPWRTIRDLPTNKPLGAQHIALGSVSTFIPFILAAMGVMEECPSRVQYTASPRISARSQLISWSWGSAEIETIDVNRFLTEPSHKLINLSTLRSSQSASKPRKVRFRRG